MGKNIKVSIEVFGNKKLTVTLTPDELRGKNVSQVVNYIMNKEWQGEDKQTLEMINREIKSGYGYTPGIIKVRERNLQTQIHPLKLEESIEKYVQDFGLQGENISLLLKGNIGIG